MIDARSSALWRTCQSRSSVAVREGGVHLGTVERCEREHGSTADRGLVGATLQDGGQTSPVADGAKRGDGGLADQCLAVLGRGVDEKIQHRIGDDLVLAARPCCHLDHSRIVVA